MHPVIDKSEELRECMIDAQHAITKGLEDADFEVRWLANGSLRAERWTRSESMLAVILIGMTACEETLTEKVKRIHTQRAAGGGLPSGILPPDFTEEEKAVAERIIAHLRETGA